MARQLLAAAQPRATPFGELNVISLEGLIAFKLQGFINDPRRTQDLEDIRVPTQTMRDPFEALDDLMVVVEALCPTWPSRESFGSMPDLRL